MADTSNDARMGTIRSAVDLNVVGDNILDIAEFTVEKHEFRNNTTFSAEERDEVVGKIKNALWQRVDELKVRRQQILADMFNLAEATLNEVISREE